MLVRNRMVDFVEFNLPHNLPGIQSTVRCSTIAATKGEFHGEIAATIREPARLSGERDGRCGGTMSARPHEPSRALPLVRP